MGLLPAPEREGQVCQQGGDQSNHDVIPWRQNGARVTSEHAACPCDRLYFADPFGGNEPGQLTRRTIKASAASLCMEGEVVDITQAGEGVVKIDGRVHFVAGALTGETIRFVAGRKQTWHALRGTLQKVLVESPHRVRTGLRVLRCLRRMQPAAPRHQRTATGQGEGPARQPAAYRSRDRRGTCYRSLPANRGTIVARRAPVASTYRKKVACWWDFREQGSAYPDFIAPLPYAGQSDSAHCSDPIA